MQRLMRYSAVIGLVLFVFVLFSIKYEELVAILAGVNFWWLLAGSLLIPAEVMLKSWKLKIIVNTHSSYSWSEAIKTYLVGLPFGAVTPGKIGDLAKICNLKKTTDLSTTTGMSLLVAERLFELITLMILALIGFLVVLARFSQKIIFVGPVIGALLIIGASIIFLNPLAARALARLLYKIVVPEKHRPKLKDSFVSFYEGVSRLMSNRECVLFSLALSFLSWVVIATRAFLYGYSMGIRVGYYYFIFLIPAVIAIELLPISIMGMGTREYALMFSFGALGVGKEHAVSLSLTTFVLGPIPPTILGYILAVRDQLSFGRVREISLAEERS